MKQHSVLARDKITRTSARLDNSNKQGVRIQGARKAATRGFPELLAYSMIPSHAELVATDGKAPARKKVVWPVALAGWHKVVKFCCLVLVFLF
jgi:hypothetical protein